MALFRSPGLTLLVVGLVLLVVVRPVLGWLPFVGGLLGGMSFLFGFFCLIGGAFLIVRRLMASSR